MLCSARSRLASDWIPPRSSQFTSLFSWGPAEYTQEGTAFSAQGSRRAVRAASKTVQLGACIREPRAQDCGKRRERARERVERQHSRHLDLAAVQLGACRTYPGGHRVLSRDKQTRGGGCEQNGSAGGLHQGAGELCSPTYQPGSPHLQQTKPHPPNMDPVPPCKSNSAPFAPSYQPSAGPRRPPPQPSTCLHSKNNTPFLCAPSYQPQCRPSSPSTQIRKQPAWRPSAK